MMIRSRFSSESATFDELKEFSWYQYGSRKVFDLKTLRNTSAISQGKIFGVRLIRGNRYYVILQDGYHVNFTIEAEEYERLLKVSEPVKMPKMTDIRANGKAPRLSEGSESRKWDSPKFKAARKIKAEDVHGVDFANYQWRKIVSDKGLVFTKTLKLKHSLKTGDVFGVRWIAPTKGGIYIDLDGRRIRIKTEEAWQAMLDSSKVLTKDKWPEGKLSLAEMRGQLQRDYKESRAKKVEENRKILQLKRADEERNREKARLAAAEKRKKLREEAEALKQSAKEASVAAKLEKAKKAKLMRETTDERVRDVLKSDRLKKEKALKDKLPEVDDFDDDSLADDLDFDADDTSQGYTPVGVEDFDPESDSLSRDASDPVELLDSAVEELRQKQRKMAIKEIVPEDEPDEEVPEDELEYDDEDAPDESEDDSDADAEEEDIEEEEEEESPSEDGEEDTDDSEDTEEPADDEPEAEDESEEEQSDDEPDEEEEEAEVYEKAVEGDIVNFHSDESENRDFIITGVYPFPKNNNIMVYRLYDLTNEPEEWRTVRVDTTKSATFEKSVDFVRKASAAELKEARKLVERYEKNNDPIVS